MANEYLRDYLESKVAPDGKIIENPHGAQQGNMLLEAFELNNVRKGVTLGDIINVAREFYTSQGMKEADTIGSWDLGFMDDCNRAYVVRFEYSRDERIVSVVVHRAKPLRKLSSLVETREAVETSA